MSSQTRKDRLETRLSIIKVRMALVKEKMQEMQLRWFGHLIRRLIDTFAGVNGMEKTF